MPSSSSPKGSGSSARVNVRRPEVMQRVQAEVQNHYRSSIVERVRESGGRLTIGNTTIRLAKEFGFCYGVERAIELAYAARKVFQDQRIYLIGEIIHNPEVNRQLREMNIRNIADEGSAGLEVLGPDDVVIIPAFGTTLDTQQRLEAQGCQVIDTTCGDVLSVYKRVRQYAQASFTSIIHGKHNHEEAKATASRAVGPDGPGHYLIILDLEQTDSVCRYIVHGGNRDEFLAQFAGAVSQGFDPDRDLRRVGVANQTTMLKSETEEMQRRVRNAILERDQGNGENFRIFETICGATQERQDALHEMLAEKMDLLLVVGGYNSSNTSQLVKIGGQHLPTFFIRSAECLRSLREIAHFDLSRKSEVTSYSEVLLGEGPVTVGVTAGASCPNNLIEETIRKVFELRGQSISGTEA